jgi:hypothetical protein
LIQIKVMPWVIAASVLLVLVRTMEATAWYWAAVAVGAFGLFYSVRWLAVQYDRWEDGFIQRRVDRKLDAERTAPNYWGGILWGLGLHPQIRAAWSYVAVGSRGDITVTISHLDGIHHGAEAINPRRWPALLTQSRLHFVL